MELFWSNWVREAGKGIQQQQQDDCGIGLETAPSPKHTPSCAGSVSEVAKLASIQVSSHAFKVYHSMKGCFEGKYHLKIQSILNIYSRHGHKI